MASARPWEMKLVSNTRRAPLSCGNFQRQTDFLLLFPSQFVIILKKVMPSQGIVARSCSHVAFSCQVKKVVETGHGTGVTLRASPVSRCPPVEHSAHHTRLGLQQALLGRMLTASLNLSTHAVQMKRLRLREENLQI